MFEKTVPWGRTAVVVTAAILLALAVAVVAAPGALPGLTVPGGGMAGDAMTMP